MKIAKISTSKLGVCVCQAQEDRIKQLELKVEDLEWENKGIAEWRGLALEALHLLKNNNVAMPPELAFFASKL